MEQSFIAYIENSIKNNWDLDALTDYKGATLQYKDVARKIEKLHIIFEESGIRKGDKIAVCGRNSSIGELLSSRLSLMERLSSPSYTNSKLITYTTSSITRRPNSCL